MTEHKDLKEVVEEKGVKLLKDNLLILTEQVLRNILINQADNYPQAPISGGTPRMREAINHIDRTDDEENDLIWTSGIKISDYISEEKDYTQFIMKVVNSAIEITQENKDDKR